MFAGKIKPFVYLGIFYLLVSFIVRVIFFFYPITTASFGFFEAIKILGIGLLNDILVFILASSFLALYFLFLSNSKYKKPYGYMTVFVIISDHCASSAGKTELPMDKYRIPAMIFSEGFIQPQKFDSLMSQIDVMPTLFGLLNFNYQSKFLGQDVFSQNFVPKAYVATYQDLGLIKDNHLTIISPTKNVKQYSLKLQPSNLPENFKLKYDEIPVAQPQKTLVDDCISVYQSTSFWLKKNLLNRN